MSALSILIFLDLKSCKAEKEKKLAKILLNE